METKGSKMKLMLLLIIPVLFAVCFQNREAKTVNKAQAWVLLIAGVVALGAGAAIALAKHM